jgi:hypothetical protein
MSVGVVPVIFPLSAVGVEKVTSIYRYGLAINASGQVTGFSALH